MHSAPVSPCLFSRHPRATCPSPSRSTREALKAHNKRDDIWFSIHGRVYNVTKYLEDHPGGEEVLMDRGGQDASEDFEDVGHSNDARKTLAKYEVGELPPSERRSTAASGGGPGGGGGGMMMALPVLLVAAALGYYFFLQGA